MNLSFLQYSQELDPVTLHNQALMNMEANPTQVQSDFKMQLILMIYGLADRQADPKLDRHKQSHIQTDRHRVIDKHVQHRYSLIYTYKFLMIYG